MERSPSSLTSFLAATFPGIAASRTATCWVAKVLARNPWELASISEAITSVSGSGCLAEFQTRCAREHPVTRRHQRQYDLRLLDCFTEACAFAWAADRTRVAPAFLFDREGEPDLRVTPGLFVEAKGVWNSDRDQELVGHMLSSDTAVTELVDVNFAAIIKKFEAAYNDAVSKFARVNASHRVVFFNLIGLDVPAIPKMDDVLSLLTRWAVQKRETSGAPGIVLCRIFDWRNPFYDSTSIR